MVAKINLTQSCTCDEVHTCQQCYEEWQEEKKQRLQRLEDALKKKRYTDESSIDETP